MFTMSIDTKGSAFGDDGPLDVEVQRLVRSVADQIGFGHTHGILHDINGNRCGEWTMDSTAASRFREFTSPDEGDGQ